jgi:hypothetical protein
VKFRASSIVAFRIGAEDAERTKADAPRLAGIEI